MIAPRFDLPLVDSNGRISREWYKYLVQLGNSVNSSTLADDLTLAATSDVEMSAAAKRQADAALLLAFADDQRKTPDMSVLAWWPGDAK